MDEKEKIMLHDLHKAICGDDFGNEGIVKKTCRHEKKIQRHDNYIYGIIGAGTLATFLLKFGDEISKIFK